MQTKLGLTCVIGCLMMSSALVASCGSGSKKPSSTDMAAAGDGNSVGGENGSHVGGDGAVPGGGTTSGSGGTNGGEGGTSGSSTGARPNVDPGHPDPVDPNMPGAGGDSSADSPDFDGVDLSGVSEATPTGCVGGFDPVAGTLAISVGGDAPIVHVAVHAGVVQANGVDCESAAGDPAQAADVSALSIDGSAAADAVYLDLSDEAFSGAFAADGGITIALGGGDDTVTVLGTLGTDVFYAGSDADTLVLDLTGDERVDLSITGSPAVLLSTGGQQDQVRGDGVALGVEPAALPLTIYGGGKGDSLVGGAAADSLFGGIGDDWFDAGAAPAGADTFDGGEGRDTVDFSARTEPLVITMGAGKNDGEAGEGAAVEDSVEGVYGGQAVNDISGGANDNEVWGGPLADRLSGGAGADRLYGSLGNDTLKGETGDDTLYGDEGDDDLDGGLGDDLLDDQTGKNTLTGGPGDADICNWNGASKASACEL
jgi:Ca2+-binding RTX toxin-like protein